MDIGALVKLSPRLNFITKIGQKNQIIYEEIYLPARAHSCTGIWASSSIICTIVTHIRIILLQASRRLYLYHHCSIIGDLGHHLLLDHLCGELRADYIKDQTTKVRHHKDKVDY